MFALRRGSARLAVSEVMIRREATRRWSIPATHKWVRGWMDRQGLAVRLRTTHKEVNTERMQQVKWLYQNKVAVIFNSTLARHIFNTDETSVYFDSAVSRTVDIKGARTVEIGHTEHYADRISVVLCCSYSGELLPPLIIHRCDEKQNFKKTGTFTRSMFDTPRGGDQIPGVEMWVTHTRTAWLDTELMCRWLDTIYAEGVRFFGFEPAQTVLFMDGCSAHHSEESEQVVKELGIQVETLPPNCTPFLQPCDQHVNALFKKFYEDEWQRWYSTIGYKDKTKPKEEYSRLRKATQVEVNKWIANATARLILSQRAIRASWRNTLVCQTTHIMHMSNQVWYVIGAFLCSDSKADAVSWTMVCQHRKMYGSKFNVPVTKRKKRKVEEEAAAPVVHTAAIEEKVDQTEWVNVTIRHGKRKTRCVAAVQGAVMDRIRGTERWTNSGGVAEVSEDVIEEPAKKKARPFTVVQPAWMRHQ